MPKLIYIYEKESFSYSVDFESYYFYFNSKKRTIHLHYPNMVSADNKIKVSNIFKKQFGISFLHRHMYDAVELTEEDCFKIQLCSTDGIYSIPFE